MLQPCEPFPMRCACSLQYNTGTTMVDGYGSWGGELQKGCHPLGSASGQPDMKLGLTPPHYRDGRTHLQPLHLGGQVLLLALLFRMGAPPSACCRSLA